MSKRLKIVLMVLFSIFILGALFIWGIVNEPPPEFFPLDNSQARYTIIKSSTLFQGWVEGSPSAQYDLEARYYLEYRGEGVFNDENNTNFFRITIGKSKIDLSPFINKNVLITKGKFVSSSKQCIVDDCIDIYGPYVVLDIDSIREVE